MIPFIGCPHCRGIRFVAGPRGGASQNVTCCHCSARYNLVIPPLPGPLLLLEELSAPTGERAEVRGRAYIIELIPDDD
jgi:hypothetical protein